MPSSLSIFGAGRLGQTLAKLLQDKKCFEIKQIYSRQKLSRQEAKEFIGLSQAQCAASLGELQSSEFWLIATPDSAFEQACQDLLPIIRAGDIVFHCSGALDSSTLHSLKKAGAYTASIHPLHSFAKPSQSVLGFAGSYCAYEGDEEALEILISAFETIGANCFAISGNKWLYHSASVIACNYLAPLLDASYQAFSAAGIDNKLAANLLKPLIEGSLSNIREQGPASALTGPIARGDADFVIAQLQALQNNDDDLAELYQDMAKHTTRLALRRENAKEVQSKLLELKELLES
ncbi:Rossmann-like and DUF2520 domain-containing protein [uncultured Pseudoteredinibacter sp.]|uniref:Rossmann-like and DUF2520 domain-containing protein n=1 Tax=uncultured Pseudoteredinibacter sp. TaxID=1641701 RepID=UPI00262423D9|nr:Rossmann-like and DUF2520 domain-containing protein [uncultured Pseudoteredinibacter sp.]